MDYKLRKIHEVMKLAILRANPELPPHIFDKFDYDIGQSEDENEEGEVVKVTLVTMTTKPEYVDSLGDHYIELKVNPLKMNEYLDLLYENGFDVWGEPKFEDLGELGRKYRNYGLDLTWVKEKPYSKRDGTVEVQYDKATAFLYHTLNDDEPYKYGRKYGVVKKAWNRIDYADKPKQVGLLLDIARTAYTVDDIKKAIDYLAANNGTYLQLHFCDNENYALESSLLLQSAAWQSVIKDYKELADNFNIDPETGLGWNPLFKTRYLKRNDVKEIVSYAASKNITVIPELNTPGHCKAIKRRMDMIKRNNRTNGLNFDNMFLDDGTMNFNNADLRTFVSNLIEEIIDLFGRDQLTYFHLGGDEVPFNENWSHELPEYFNALQETLSDYGITGRVWNDCLLKKDIEKETLSKIIEVTYWSWDGQRQDEKEAAHLREIRATPVDLIKNDYRVINACGYYTYVVPKKTDHNSHDANYAARDLLGNWDLSVWDKHDSAEVLSDEAMEQGMIGAQLSIWGENLGNDKVYGMYKYLDNYSYQLKNLARITQATDEETLLALEAIYNNGFVNEEYDVFVDLSAIDNLEDKSKAVFDLSYNGHQVLYIHDLLKSMEANKEYTYTVWGTGDDYVILPSSFKKDASDEITNTEYQVKAQAWKHNQIKFYIDERIRVIYRDNYAYQSA